jgi:hypothetical protein
MALSFFASVGVDIGVVGGIIIIVFFMLFAINRLSEFIKTYKTNRRVEQQVLPQHNSRACTTATTHRSRTIAPEPREPPKIINSATGTSVSPSAYQESELVGIESCIVCLYPLQEGMMVLRLPACGHLLHDVCLCPWFCVNSVCPGCGEPVNAQLTVKVGAV